MSIESIRAHVASEDPVAVACNPGLWNRLWREAVRGVEDFGLGVDLFADNDLACPDGSNVLCLFHTGKAIGEYAGLMPHRKWELAAKLDDAELVSFNGE